MFILCFPIHLHQPPWQYLDDFFSCTFLLPFAFWAMFHRTSSHFDLVTSCLFAFLISILIISGYKQSHTNFGLMAVCHPCSIEQNSNMHTASFLEEALGSSSIMSSCCSCVGFDISSVATSFATQKMLFIWQEKSRSKIGGAMLCIWQMILASILDDTSTLLEAQKQTILHLQLGPSWTPFLTVTERWHCGEK